MKRFKIVYDRMIIRSTPLYLVKVVKLIFYDFLKKSYDNANDADDTIE